MSHQWYLVQPVSDSGWSFIPLVTTCTSWIYNLESTELFYCDLFDLCEYLPLVLGLTTVPLEAAPTDRNDSVTHPSLNLEPSWHEPRHHLTGSSVSHTFPLYAIILICSLMGPGSENMATFWRVARLPTVGMLMLLMLFMWLQMQWCLFWTQDFMFRKLKFDSRKNKNGTTAL